MTIDAALENSVSYLSSTAALDSIERDPYWPKWDSPWWHMLLLFEMDLASAIPSAAVAKMVQVLKTHYLPVFPIHEDEVPAGTDPYRKIACLCAVGGIYQVLFSCGVDVDSELPWMRPWFLRYQLPDGGLNCDEKAYARPTPKSSIMSTLPCLEAVLFSRKRALTPPEIEFLNKGAEYLLRQKLFRRVSSGEVIDASWLEIKFPRFYDYDFLRGYYFLAKWREVSGFRIPDELVDEVEALVKVHESDGGIRLKRYNLIDPRSYNPLPEGTWSMGPASEFDLLKSVSGADIYCEPLSKKWDEVRPRSALVTESYETAYKNPIRLSVGDLVTIVKRETNPEWLGWVFCTDDRGISGWVSEKILDESSEKTRVVKNYDATELTVAKDESVKIYYEEFGWCWCRNKNGTNGWVPARNLKRHGL